MAEINTYPVTAATIEAGSFMDIDQEISPGVFESQKVPLSVLLSAIGNLYVVDGLLTSDRVIDGDSNELTIINVKEFYAKSNAVATIEGDTNVNIISNAVTITSLSKILLDASEGVRPPNMNTATRDAIPSPTESVFIYNKDTKRNEYFHPTLGWIPIGTYTDLEWAAYSGTRAGGDLIATLGDYDDSSNGIKIIIDDAGESISLVSTDVINLKADTNIFNSNGSGFYAALKASNITANRNQLFQDKDMTFAGLDDIPNDVVIVSLGAIDADISINTNIDYFDAPYAGTLTSVEATLETAPTGSVATFDVDKNGVTMLSTKITIDATEKTSTTATTPPVISVTTFAKGDRLSFAVDGVGSTIAGAGGKITLYITRT